MKITRAKLFWWGWAVFLAFAFKSVAATVTISLAWNASPAAEVWGYKIYFGSASRNYFQWVDVGNVTNATFTMTDFPPAVYVAATAYGANGAEGEFSPELVIPESTARSFEIATSFSSQPAAASTLSAQPPLAVSFQTANTLASKGAAQLRNDLKPEIKSKPLAAPTIVSPPQDKLVLTNGTTRFKVSAAGKNLKYQWLHDGTNLPGATKSILILKHCQPEQAGVYFVIVTNAAGKIASLPVWLTLVDTPAAEIGSPVRSDKQFAFHVSGLTGHKYIVQSSTNLITWRSRATNTAPFVFADTNASKVPQRFYRTVYRADLDNPTLQLVTTNQAGRPLFFSTLDVQTNRHLLEISWDLTNWIPVLTNAVPFPPNGPDLNSPVIQSYIDRSFPTEAVSNRVK